MSTQTEDAQENFETSIVQASPADAEDIVSAFRDEYVKYYGMYVDEDELAEFLTLMNGDFDKGKRPEEDVRTVKDSRGGFVGAGAIKFQDNMAELGSTIITPEARGAENTEGKGIYEELFDDRQSDVEDMIDEESDPVDLAYTQLLADKSAKTQHIADKKGYAVTAVLNKKFPVAYEGKGRVTAVDMLWADSNIENEVEKVYVPEDIWETVDAALENINGKRSNDLGEITREHYESDVDRTEQNYHIKSKAIDKPEDDSMNFAEVEIVADDSGDYSWNDVIDEIEEAEAQIENPEDDYWIGVSMDVNGAVSADAVNALLEEGFDPAGFNPGKLEAGEENRDALELQYSPSDERYVKEFIDEAAEFMDKAGMSYETPEEASTDHESSQALKV